MTLLTAYAALHISGTTRGQRPFRAASQSPSTLKPRLCQCAFGQPPIRTHRVTRYSTHLTEALAARSAHSIRPKTDESA